MTILNLDLENFMNISHASLEFKKGINVIAGKNGAGKSAILEAIAFCLIERRRGDSWKDYIKSGQTKFTIHLILQKSKDPSDVVEFNYEGNGKFGAVQKRIMYRDQVYVNSECNDFIKDAFDSEMLENIVFTLQDSQPVTHSTPLERRTIFKKIFNSNFTTTVEKIKTDLEQRGVLVQSIGYEMQAVKSKVYPKMRLESMDPGELTIYLNKEQDIEAQIKEASMDKSQQEEFNRKEELLQKYVSPSYQKAQAEVKSAKKAVDDNVEEATFADNKLSALAHEKRENKAELKRVSQQIKDIHNLREEKYRRSQDIKIIMRALADRLQAANVELSVVTRRHAAHLKGVCDECGQACDVSHAAELKKDIDIKTIVVEDLGSKFDSFGAEIAEINAFAQQSEERLLPLYKEQSNLESLIKSIIKQEDEFSARKSEASKRTPILQTNFLVKREELSQKEKEVFELQDWVATHTPKWEKTSNTKDLELQLSQIRDQIQDYNQRMRARIEREILNKKLDEQLQKDGDAVSVLAGKLNDASMEIKDLEFIKLFYETTLPNFINTKACTLLEEYMNNFLSTTKKGFQFKLVSAKRGIDFMYKAVDKSDWLNVKLASGFETSLANLAFKCAVAFSYGSELLVLDEPDAYSSESNSERLFETITSINDGFEQIIIITHKTRAMQFLKENGASIYTVDNGEFSQNSD